jgi:hypothetical protein
MRLIIVENVKNNIFNTISYKGAVQYILLKVKILFEYPLKVNLRICNIYLQKSSNCGIMIHGQCDTLIVHTMSTMKPFYKFTSKICLASIIHPWIIVVMSFFYCIFFLLFQNKMSILMFNVVLCGLRFFVLFYWFLMKNGLSIM